MVEGLRAATQIIINLNPVTITINRVTHVSDGAGGMAPEAPVALAPFTGRISPSMSSGREAYLQTEAGVEQWAGWDLMCPHDADIQASTTVKDSFTALMGRQFEVMRVVPRKIDGQVYRITALLREIS